MTAGSAIALAHLADAEQVFAALHQVNFLLVLTSSLGFLAAFFIRTFRMALVLNVHLSTHLVRVAAFYIFLVGVLPGKLGELSLPLLLKRNLNLGLAFGAGCLIFIRILDLLVLAAIGSFLVILFSDDLDFPAWGEGIGLAAGCGFMMAAALLPTAARFAFNALPTGLKDYERLQYLLEGLLGAARSVSRSRQMLNLALTVGIWCFFFLAAHGISLAFSATTSLAATGLAVVAASFAYALPINGVANLGPFQVAWVAVMVPLGVPLERAAVAAIAVHLSGLLLSALIAGFSLLFMPAEFKQHDTASDAE